MEGPEESGEAAAIHHDGVVDFIPEGSIKVSGGDAQVTADVDDDGADRPAPQLGGDFLLRRKVREARIPGAVVGLGVRLRDRPPYEAWLVRWGCAEGFWREVLVACGSAAQPRLQRSSATQEGLTVLRALLSTQGEPRRCQAGSCRKCELGRLGGPCSSAYRCLDVWLQPGVFVQRRRPIDGIFARCLAATRRGR